MRSLDIPAEQQVVYDYPVRRFSDNRQEILEDLVLLRREWQPELVLFPASTDVHQDHSVIHQEGLRAFKDITLWGYDMPWNQVSFSAQAVVELQRQHVERKWEALQSYKSQLAKDLHYLSWDFTEALARVRGSHVKAKYAEAFEVIRIRL